MGYEIIYKTFTIKKDEVYIPFVVIGSNNCYQVMWNGREKRERNLYNAEFFFNHKRNFTSLSEMDKHFEFKSIQKEMDGLMIQGRYKTSKGLLKSFKKYIFTDMELKLKPKFIHLFYLKDLTNEEKNHVIHIFENELKDKTILTKKEEETIIDKCLNQLDDETKNKVLNYRNKNQLIYYEYREYQIENAFREKYKKRKKGKITDYEEMKKLIKSDNAVDFSNLDNEEFEKELEKFIGKQVVLKSHETIYRGRIKKTHNGDIGFFKYRVKRKYNPLSKQGYGYAQLKVDKLVEIK